MTDNERPKRLVLTAQSIAYLPRHVKLRHDKARGRWLLLAPERVLTPDDIAVAILTRLDGGRTLQDVAEELGAEYDAPVDDILSDVLGILQDLADRGYIKV